ncbi:hypothetical protein AVEN_209979-1 [Araneus ventricosus]|uniref:Uncharacterized protein n=1 Tax=Araneus ventricosus TaxID=182803 RepID=A0A4Y2DDD9_ARAVE|nr:hypothetical protein AVEN_209979-1 [Araneus ventricosus]
MNAISLSLHSSSLVLSFLFWREREFGSQISVFKKSDNTVNVSNSGPYWRMFDLIYSYSNFPTWLPNICAHQDPGIYLKIPYRIVLDIDHFNFHMIYRCNRNKRESSPLDFLHLLIQYGVNMFYVV